MTYFREKSGGLTQACRNLTKHHVDDEFGLHIADHRVVQGMVESDRDHDGRVPLLIIDGREITWDEFGRMLMSFEGWQFKLNLADKSEEV